MKKQARRDLTILASLVSILACAIGLTVAYSDSEPELTGPPLSSLCTEGITYEDGSDQYIFDRDYERVEKFIKQTGVHLYAHVLTNIYFKAATEEAYKRVYREKMGEYCAAGGYPLSQWDSSRAEPLNSIFMVYGYTVDEEGREIQTPFIAASSDLAEMAAKGAPEFERNLGVFGPGYMTSSLHAFLDAIQP